MTILYIGEDIFTKTKKTEADRHAIYSITAVCITLSTMCSNIGIILWIYAADFININNIRRVLPDNFVRMLSFRTIMYASGILMTLTLFTFYLLFKQNRNPIPVTLGTLFLCFFTIPIIYFLVQNISANQNDTDFAIPVVHETGLQHLLELAAGVTNLFFGSLIGKAIDHFNSSTPDTDDGDFDAPLFFIFFGSMWGILTAVLISSGTLRPNENNVHDLMKYNLALVGVVMANVIAVTYNLLEAYAFLELVPGLVSLFVWLYIVFFPDEHPATTVEGEIGPNAEGNVSREPITLSITNITFTGLIAAISYSGRYSHGRRHLVFALLASSGLDSALLWRVLTHDAFRTRSYKKVEKVISGFTLALLFLTVFTSLFIVWGAF